MKLKITFTVTSEELNTADDLFQFTESLDNIQRSLDDSSLESAIEPIEEDVSVKPKKKKIGPTPNVTNEVKPRPAKKLKLAKKIRAKAKTSSKAKKAQKKNKKVVNKKRSSNDDMSPSYMIYDRFGENVIE